MTPLLSRLTDPHYGAGAETYIDTSDADSSATLGGLGGLMGGGAMAVLGELQALGLGMGQIQGVTQETVNFARERGLSIAVRGGGHTASPASAQRTTRS